MDSVLREGTTPDCGRVHFVEVGLTIHYEDNVFRIIRKYPDDSIKTINGVKRFLEGKGPTYSIMNQGVNKYKTILAEEYNQFLVRWRWQQNMPENSEHIMTIFRTNY